MSKRSARSPRIPAALLALAVALTALFSNGCTAGSSSIGQPPGSSPIATSLADAATPSHSGGYTLKITESGRLTAGLSMEDIDQLPKAKLNADGKEQEGRHPATGRLA